MERYVLDINIHQGDNTEDSAVSKNIAPSTPSRNPAAQSLKKTTVAAVASVQAINMVKQIFSYHAGNVGVRNGNTDAQDKIDFAIESAGTIASIAGAFAINPVLGALALANTGIGIAQKIDTYFYERKWETIGLAQERLRAGASYNRSRGGRGAY